MKFLQLLPLLALLIISCEKEPASNQDNLLGNYSGLYTYHSSYPVNSDSGSMYMWSFDTTYFGSINVSKADNGSYRIKPLSFSHFLKEFDFQLDPDFSWSMYSGGGSSAHREKIQFTEDSIFYSYFKACGIPCSGSGTFKGKKQ